MSEHATLAPSASERWINCPGSIKLSDKFEDTTSVYAREGSVAHKLAELKICKEFLKTEHKTRFKEVKADELYTPDMEDYTDDYIDYINYILKNSNIKDPIIIPEKKLSLEFIAPQTFGTADCLIMTDNELHVVDFKYGQNVKVSAHDNTQLKIYALGALDLFDNLIFNFENVNLHIVQPRMNNFSSFTIKKFELFNWLENIVKPQAKKALNGEDEIKPGAWCKFCRAKTICRKYSKNYPIEMELKNPNELTPEELAHNLKALEGLNTYLKELKEFMTSEALKGNRYPGLKLVEGRKSRKWKNEEIALKTAELHGYKEEDLYTKKPLTLPGVEKLMGKKKFNEIMGELVEQERGKPTLVDIDDKRPEYVLQVGIDEYQDLIGKEF